MTMTSDTAQTNLAGSHPPLPDADSVGPRRALPAGGIVRRLDDLSAVQRAVAMQRLGAGDNIARVAGLIGTTKAVLEELCAEPDMEEAIEAEAELMALDDDAFSLHLKKLLRQGLETAILQRRTSTINIALRLSHMLDDLGRRQRQHADEREPIDPQRRRQLLYLDSLAGEQLGEYLWAGTRTQDKDGRPLRKAGPPPAHFVENLLDPSIVPDSFDADDIAAGLPVPPPEGFTRLARDPLELPGHDGYLDDPPPPPATARLAPGKHAAGKPDAGKPDTEKPAPGKPDAAKPAAKPGNDNRTPSTAVNRNDAPPPASRDTRRPKTARPSPKTPAPATPTAGGQAAASAGATAAPLVVHAREPRPAWLRQNGSNRPRGP